MNESTYPRDIIRTPDSKKEETELSTSEEGLKTGVGLLDPYRLWQRTRELRYWLFGIVAVAVSLAIFLTLLQTPLFRATAMIEISRVDSASANIEEIALEGEARDQQYYQTQYVLLKSRALAERVVESQNLPQDRAALTALGFSEDSSPNVRSIANKLLSSVRIEPLERSNLVGVSMTSSSAEVSAKLANSWAEQFLDANYQKRFGDTLDARRQLANQLAELRENLEMSEAELSEYAKANGIVVIQQSSAGEDGVGSKQTLVESQLATLNSALAEATARRIAAESAARAGGNSTEGQAAIRNRIAEVEATLARLRTTLGPENSQVQASEAELRSLRQAQAQETGLSSSEIRARLNAAQREEAELQRRFDAARDRYVAQQDQGVEYGILEREVSTNRELYNALLQRYKELGVAASGRNNMTIVEPAEAPRGPYSPSLVYNVLLALLGSLVACAGLVLVRELLDNSLRDPSELRRRLGTPLLGLVPQFETDEVEDQLRDPRSILSEAYASSRVAIDFASGPEDKIFMVTSTRPNEGKSLSSLALAYNFARQGNRVLLIDMDLRRKGLSIRLHQSKQSDGMATYLAGQIETLPVVHSDEFGLDFVRSGKATLNPADILSTSRTEIVLSELKEKYDTIIIDAPPVLGLADTPQLANAVDGIVYIVQANESTFRSVGQALSRLRATQSKILGVIVTKLDRRNESYSYGYGSGYGYGYSYGAEPGAASS